MVVVLIVVLVATSSTLVVVVKVIMNITVAVAETTEIVSDVTITVLEL